MGKFTATSFIVNTISSQKKIQHIIWNSICGPEARILKIDYPNQHKRVPPADSLDRYHFFLQYNGSLIQIIHKSLLFIWFMAVVSGIIIYNRTFNRFKGEWNQSTFKVKYILIRLFKMKIVICMIFYSILFLFMFTSLKMMRRPK
jgi:hypothetical protein